MPNISIRGDTYTELKELKSYFERTRGGTWTYDDVVKKAFEALKKEVKADGE